MKYKLVTRCSDEVGIFNIEYPTDVNQIPVQIYYEMAQKYISKPMTRNTLVKLTQEYVDFIKDKVTGLIYYVDKVVLKATIEWDSINPNI